MTDIQAEHADHAETKWRLRYANSVNDEIRAENQKLKAQYNEVLKAQNYLKDAVLCGLSDQEIARRARLLVEATRPQNRR